MRNSIVADSNRVSEEVRRAHSRAIRAREQWRRRYAVLTSSIRNTKRAIADAHRNNTVNCAGEIELRALRHYANLMMMRRDFITDDLRATAYEYVDIIAV